MAPRALKQQLAESLSDAWAVSRSRLERGRNGLSIARELAGAVDAAICRLAAEAPGTRARFALLAVGGYGRGELAPSSDLDLLFLRHHRGGQAIGPARDFVLYALWDLGFKVGHATRTVDENLDLARRDHTVQTALLEARFLFGDEAMATGFIKRFRRQVVQRDHAGFIAAKLRERDDRHRKSGASRYMVEPNIKEGKGGLRDLHTLAWMARHRYGPLTLRGLVDAGVFSSAEVWAYCRALEFLWTVRNHLHFATERAEERLTFDLQPELARRMGFAPRDDLSAVEHFMRRYFLTARRVGTLTRVLCARLEADETKTAPRGLERFVSRRRRAPLPLAPGFHNDGGRLNIDALGSLDAPESVVRIFTLAEKHDLDIHPAALGAAARRVRQLPESWRDDEAARAAFLEAIAGKRPAAALRLMNEAGVLGRLIPEFGRIIAQMQFNMYHHFTVDEHTMRAIETLTEIEQGRHKHQHPLATSVFPKIVNRRALFLAMLLHDTGKGDGDQQVEGEKSARAACARLGLPEEEVELVAWLVRHHLVMNDFAQKRDIGDPRTVASFAEIVGTVERLRLLLVLTVADIRSVGPNVWNDWKGQLLRDLFRLAEVALRGGDVDEERVQQQLAELAAQAKLSFQGGPEPSACGWLDAFDHGYWLSHDADALAWHAREVAAASALPHVATRIRKEQGVTEVLVHAADRPGLFASLAAAISASGANIAAARVHTTRDGAAFDIFSIQAGDLCPFGDANPGILRMLASRLQRAALIDEAAPAPPPLSRRTAAFSIEPWVRVDNEATPRATVIEASGRDRLGLLAALARVCAEAQMSITSAHIDTYGERAFDVFYVQDETGAQLKSARRIAGLRAELEAVLRAGEPDAAANASGTPLAVARASTAR